MLKLDDVRREIDLEKLFPYWPLIARVANRVGPWFRLGPLNINGRVKSIAMHPSNSDILYAGAANGGVWKSTNGGNSWGHQLEVRGHPRDRRGRDGAQQRQRGLRRHR